MSKKSESNTSVPLFPFGDENISTEIDFFISKRKNQSRTGFFHFELKKVK